jgi:hypothetical protein
MCEARRNRCVSSLLLKSWTTCDRWSPNCRWTLIDRLQSCCFLQNYRHRDRHHLFSSPGCGLA